MLHSFWKSLDPISQIKKDFWKFDKYDLICCGVSITSTIVIWISVAYQYGIDQIISYWDGPNYLYAGATLYNIPEQNPWTVFFKYPPSYFACHLPGYPLLIRLCSYLFFKNYKLGFYLSILVSDILLNYSFRRLLIITNAVSSPLFSTILLNFIPLRLIIYHSVGASEPLFLTFVCLAFIFYKLENKSFAMLLCVWGACFTRIEGMALGFTIGLCYLLRFRLIKAFGMFLTFLAPGSLILLHQWKFNDALAYIHFNQNSQQLINFPPFSELLNPQISNDEFYDNSFIGFYLIIFIGVLFVIPRSLPIAIFASVFLLYVSLLFHIDIYRYAIPASVFSFIIGYDFLFSSSNGKRALVIFLPIYIIITTIYASGQISSNCAWPDFMNYMFQTIYSQ